MWNGPSALEHSAEFTPNEETDLPCDAAIALLTWHPEGLEATLRRATRTSPFTAGNGEVQSQEVEAPTRPHMEEWRKNAWHLHTMGRYSILERKVILDFLRSEMSKSQTTILWLHLCVASKVVKSTETERTVGPVGVRRRKHGAVGTDFRSPSEYVTVRGTTRRIRICRWTIHWLMA